MVSVNQQIRGNFRLGSDFVQNSRSTQLKDLAFTKQRNANLLGLGLQFDYPITDLNIESRIVQISEDSSLAASEPRPSTVAIRRVVDKTELWSINYSPAKLLAAEFSLDNVYFALMCKCQTIELRVFTVADGKEVCRCTLNSEMYAKLKFSSTSTGIFLMSRNGLSFWEFLVNAEPRLIRLACCPMWSPLLVSKTPPLLTFQSTMNIINQLQPDLTSSQFQVNDVVVLLAVSRTGTKLLLAPISVLQLYINNQYSMKLECKTQAACFDDTELQVAALDYNGTILLWNTSVNLVTRRISGFHVRVKSLFLRSYNNIQCLTEERTLYNLNFVNSLFKEESKACNRLVLSPTGKYIGVLYDHAAQLWQVGLNKPNTLNFIEGAQRKEYQSLAFSADESLLALGSKKKIEIRQLDSYQLQLRYNCSSNLLNCAFSPVASVLAILTEGCAIKWDFRTDETRSVLVESCSSWTPLSYSPDGQTLVVLHKCAPRIVWSEQGFSSLFRSDNTVPSTSFCISTDSRWIAAAAGDGATVWDFRTGALQGNFKVNFLVSLVCFSITGQYIALAGTEGSLAVLTVEGGAEVHFHNFYNQNIHAIRSPSPKNFIACIEREGMVQQFKVTVRR